MDLTDTSSVASVMTQFMTGQGSEAPTPPPESVIPEPTVAVTQPEVTPAPVVDPAVATPVVAAEETPAVPVVEPETNPEPPENSAIKQVRDWGNAEKQAKIAVQQKYDEIQSRITEAEPIIAKIEESGGMPIVEHALKGHQIMHDPRFDDDSTAHEAAADVLSHFKETNPANFARFNQVMHTGYTVMVQNELAGDVLGIAAADVTEQQMEQLREAGKAIVNGTYGLAQPTDAAPVSTNGNGALPDYCYLYDEYGQKAGENPVAVADYRRGQAAIKAAQDRAKFESEATKKARLAAETAQKQELETSKGTYFTEAVQPVIERVGQLFPALATDSPEIQTQKQLIHAVIVNGLKETLRTDPQYKNTFEQMNNLLTRGAKVDAASKKIDLGNKAKFLLAKVLPVLNSLATASSQAQTAQINKITTVDTKPPGDIPVGAVETPPNRDDYPDMLAYATACNNYEQKHPGWWASRKKSA